jgi:hypothetical protein
MQLVELRRFERDIAIQVFGMSPEMLGVVESSNRATIEAAEFLYTKWLIGPRLEYLRLVLQQFLIDEYDEKLILGYESPVAEDREYQLRAAETAPWSRTVNEWRELQSLPLLPPERGDVLMIPNTVMPVFSDPENAPKQELSVASEVAKRRLLEGDERCEN